MWVGLELIWGLHCYTMKEDINSDLISSYDQSDCTKSKHNELCPSSDISINQVSVQNISEWALMVWIQNVLHRSSEIHNQEEIYRIFSVHAVHTETLHFTGSVTLNVTWQTHHEVSVYRLTFQCRSYMYVSKTPDEPESQKFFSSVSQYKRQRSFWLV